MRIYRIALLIAVLLTTGLSGVNLGWVAEERDFARHFVEIPVATQADVDTVASFGIDIWEVKADGDYRIITGLAFDEQIEALRKNGFTVVVQSPASLEESTSQAQKPDAPSYHSYESLKQDLLQLEAAYPAIAKVFDLGDSWEKRDILAIRISDDASQEDLTEPDVLFIGGQHAREWISVEVVFLLVKHLAENYSADERIKRLVDNNEIWLVPMVNPDGHEYSRTTERCWRKNRRNNGDGTFGVDLNRNYGFMWDPPVGQTSANPASDVYRGPAPFSEPEIQAIRDLVLNPARRFKAFIDFHSFGQVVLYPWGFTAAPPATVELPSVSDASAYARLASDMASLITGAHGKTYAFGQTSIALYSVSGASKDWFYSVTSAPAITIELRPRSSNEGERVLCYGRLQQIGFALPADQIIPTFEENLPAALYLIEQVQTDLLIKDNSADDGLNSSELFWLSPDIRVDAPPFDDQAVDERPVPGEVNRVFVTLRNLNEITARDVTVELYFSDAAASIVWPEGWQPTQPIVSRLVSELAALSAITLQFDWVPPLPETGAHKCLLVRLRSLQDPLKDKMSRAKLDNNIAQKNMHMAEAAPGKDTDIGAFLLANTESQSASVELQITLRDTPQDAAIRLIFSANTLQLFADATIALEGVKLESIDEQNRPILLITSQAAKISGLNLPTKEKFLIGLRTTLPPTAEGGRSFAVELVQRQSGQIAGGNAYLIKIMPSGP